jgi:hypothetical protein
LGKLDVDYYPDYTQIESDNQVDDTPFPPGGDEDGKGDLNYLINKVLFVRNDGSYTMIDNAVNRINRLNKRLRKWEEVVKKYAEIAEIRAYKIGLSYKPSKSWKEKDITEYIKNVKDYLGVDNLIAYAWVAEMQRRGEVHYHLEMITNVKGKKIPMPDKKGHWRNGSSNREEIAYVEVGYLSSDYMRKKEQKSNYPKGIRIHNTWLNGKYFGEVEYWALRSVSYPEWLVEKINYAGLINPIIKRAKGGGFIVKADENGEEYYWKNDEGYVLTGQKAIDYLNFEKNKYPIPF